MTDAETEKLIKLLINVTELHLSCSNGRNDRPGLTLDLPDPSADPENVRT